MTSPWVPLAPCDADCLGAGATAAGHRLVTACRIAIRACSALTLLAAIPLILTPLPARSRVQRGYCRLMLRCLGVRITVSGGPIRNLSGVLVVSGHVSWVDVFAIGAVVPGRFVAKSELINWPGLGLLARLMKVIPIERANLRGLPDVVDAVAARLRAGHTVVAFPEGTTWCGLAHGPFRPAMFQAAIDAGRPVQPLRLSYHHRDGRRSTAAAYVGDDTLLASVRRLMTAQRTMVRVHVASLQLPGTDRRDLAGRCECAVRGNRSRRGHVHALVA
ncbi:1-acyl-sn-glycerol-3-phosphate acyltransferase [Mycolicibacterium pulveris]|uniref:1-acyl-sn-glycerol-3-phosphate acyltransferase n=1 Tax=Mycolicibacterium pulveris TaxID=36813 RepID=A0A7I7UE29_MYCPV|nr:lysophospholipid acyltransferase family protein [Mycolicibacterium pulveris]MCV6981684.1 1-acyl-sn-glycerol-3-phosphate acyltransferase [Mycolicibacterium pulveris]BBY79320.1 1-acyl-sn-glycerol-3-phosphate acyltransferase [Mycolicibacterium pulveris]